jgi:hypothetical protein
MASPGSALDASQVFIVLAFNACSSIVPRRRLFQSVRRTKPHVTAGSGSLPVFYTFRKSPLFPKPRDATYRQRKSLCILADCTSSVSDCRPATLRAGHDVRVNYVPIRQVD